MKKALSILVILSALGVVLAGCSGGTDANATSGASSAASSAASSK